MKLAEFQKYLRKEKIDLAFFIHPDPTITYFTQNKFSFSLLMVNPKTARLLVTKLDSFPKIKDIKIKLVPKDWPNAIFSRKIKKIGISSSNLTVLNQQKLKKAFSKAKFVDVTAKLQELRSQKNAEEIKKITKACQITVKSFRALVTELPRGKLKTEQDVAYFLEKKIKDQGCELAFPTIVASGKNAAIPHHTTSNQKLKKGFLLIDMGAVYHNYCSDMTRMIYLGKPSQSELEFYNLLLAAQEAGIRAVRENLLAAELNQIVRKKLGKYSSYFIHGLGHGVGVEIHEAPSLKEDSQKIQKNQIFTIEPGIYFPGKFGLRIEDTILFDGKTKVLTTVTKNLPCLQIKHKSFK